MSKSVFLEMNFHPINLEYFIQQLRNTQANIGANFQRDVFTSEEKKTSQESEYMEEQEEQTDCENAGILDGNRPKIDEIESMEKFRLLVLPCQAGKTFHCIEKIESEIQNDARDGRSLHIIFTMNTLVNNMQFASRLLSTTKYNVGVISSRVFNSQSKKRSLLGQDSGNMEGEYFGEGDDKSNVTCSETRFPHHFKNEKDFMEYVSGEAGRFNGTHETKTRRRSNRDKLCLPVQMLVMCSHTLRFRQAFNIINQIHRNQSMNKGVGKDILYEKEKYNVERIFMYFDEIHQYINISGLRDIISFCNQCPTVKGIYGITATPIHVWGAHERAGYENRASLEKKRECYKGPDQDQDQDEDQDQDQDQDESKYNRESKSKCQSTLVNKWSHLYLEKTKHITLESYAGTKDMEFVYQPSFSKTPNQMERLREYILDNYKEEIFCRGNRVFFPAPYQLIKHQEIKDIIFERDSEALVVVINSLSRSIYYERYKKIDIPCNTEMNLNLYSIIEERRWSSRAIYFTGNQCVGMGQTLTNSLIGAFTHAIFYHDYTSESRIYQLFGRICGNIKEWDTYAKTKVYCTEYFAMTCIRMENRAYSVGTHMQGKFITEADYVFPDTVLKFSSSLKNFRVFDTQQKAIDFGKRHLNYRFRTRREDRVQLCKAFMENGNLPTFDYIRRIFEQKKNEGFKPKMILTNEFKWCVVFSSDQK